MGKSLNDVKAKSRRPVGYQRWSELLFLHWEVDPAEVQRTLPSGLSVDTFDGRAYLGLVPFFMERVRPAFLPPMPWLSWFLEMNVRTYVRDEAGNAGVWFYSLDCNQPVAVALAQRFFYLPYFYATMKAVRTADEICYEGQRAGKNQTAWKYRWQRHRVGQAAAIGTREHFLVERYDLFARDERGQLYRGQVSHAPYLIAEAHVHQFSVELAHMAGFSLHGAPVSALTAGAVEVEIFPLGPHSI